LSFRIHLIERINRSTRSRDLLLWVSEDGRKRTGALPEWGGQDARHIRCFARQARCAGVGRYTWRYEWGAHRRDRWRLWWWKRGTSCARVPRTACASVRWHWCAWNIRKR